MRLEMYTMDSENIEKLGENFCERVYFFKNMYMK